MSELLLILIPLALGAAVVQLPQIVILIILLQTRRGVANGLAYVGSKVAFHLILGALFWRFLAGVEISIEAVDGQFGQVVGAGLALTGVLLLVYALRGFFKMPDDDAAVAAGWLDKMEMASPWQAALAGIALLALDPKDWLFTLSAVELIAAANLSFGVSLFIYLIFTLLVQSLLLALITLTLLAPENAQQWLNTLNTWLKKWMRPVKTGALFLLGFYLLSKGLQNLGLF